MTTLFNRKWKVRLNTLTFESPAEGDGLQIAFEVTKSLYVAPNVCSLTVYNLNRQHRGELARLRRELRRRIRVELFAGYDSDPPLLFIGDLRGFDDTPGERTRLPESAVKVEGTDGGFKITEQRVSLSFRAGTPVTVVVHRLAEALSLGDGNLSELSGVQLGDYSTLQRPLAVHGLASRELTGFLRSLGYTWSIQNGLIQVLRNGAVLNRTGVRLNPDTGLIAASYVDRRTIKIQSFLIPEVIPGRNVIVESQRVQGSFRVHSVKYAGDSFGGDWTCDIECRVPRPLTPY